MVLGMPTILTPIDAQARKAGALYQVTANDVLWLRRAVEAEGEPREAVAKALVNLFVLRMAARPASPQSLEKLVRAYAQPVNPRWFVGGDLYEAALKKAEPGKRDVMRMAAQRRERVHSERTTFSEETDRAVMKALGGVVGSDVTDYAAPWVDGAAKGYEPRSAQEPSKNRLWTRAPGWAGYRAADGVAGQAGGFALLEALLPAALLCALAWAVAR